MLTLYLERNKANWRHYRCLGRRIRRYAICGVGVGIAIFVIGTLSGCGAAAAHLRPLPPKSESHPSPATVVAEMPRGEQGSWADIPWSKVGAGWILAEWTATTPGTPDTNQTTTPVDLFLVDPLVGRYLVTTLSSPTLLLRAWSGDGHRALLYGNPNGTNGTMAVTEMNLEQGSSHQIALPTGAGAFTQPHGTALLWFSGLLRASPPTIQRFNFRGGLQLTFSDRFSNLGAAVGSAVYAPNGVELAIGGQRGVAIVYNNGQVVKQVVIPGGINCSPVRWQHGLILVSCEMKSSLPRLWWVAANGSTVTALTAPPVSPDLGALNAWQVGPTTVVQNEGGCGNLYLSTLGPVGTTKPIVVPGVSARDSVVALGVDGNQLALHITQACGAGMAVAWFTPASNTTDIVLGPGLNGGNVLSAVLFGQSEYGWPP